MADPVRAALMVYCESIGGFLTRWGDGSVAKKKRELHAAAVFDQDLAVTPHSE